MADDVKKISKPVMNKVLENYNVYTNKYDAQDKNNSVSNVTPQWWGDEDRELEINFETGLVSETQENGEKVGMGYLDEEGIKAIKRKEENDRRVKEREFEQMLEDERIANQNKNRKRPNDDTPEQTKPGMSIGDLKKSDYEQIEEYNKNKASEESKPGNVFGKVGATVGTALSGVLEGVGSFGETLVDAATVATTAYDTSYTALADGLGMVGTAIFTDKDWNTIWNETKTKGVTATMWNGTKGFVGTKFVSGAFDKFYDNTGAGKALKNNSYAFDQVRTGGKVGGEIVGIALLTILTMGIGGAAAGGASAAGAGTEVAVVGSGVGTEVAVAGTTAVGSATAAGTAAGTAAAGSTAGGLFTAGNVFTGLTGISGFGEGAEDSWSQGGTVAQGLGEGTAKGVLNALLSKIGIKNVQSFASDGVKIAIGGAIGAGGAAANPVTSAIGHGTSYDEEYKKAGGIKSVITNGILGALGTAIAVKTAKTTVEPYGEDSSTTTRPAGAIEEKTPAVDYEGATYENPASQPKVGGPTEAAPRIEGSTVENVQGNPTPNTSGTNANATSSTTTSGASSTGAAASATNSNRAAAAGIDLSESAQKLYEYAHHKITSGRGGTANLSRSEIEKVASSLNMSVDELINMDKKIYHNIMKQVHTDVNLSLDTNTLQQLINAFYKSASGH